MWQFAVVLMVAAALSGCGHEVARVPSPDGSIDAVLVETNGGATTSFGYEVYVLPRGASWRWSGRAAFLYGATRNDSAYGANLRWTSANLLHIEYMETAASEVERRYTKIGNEVVRLELRPGIEDRNAPSGGMLYKLEERTNDQAPN